MTSTLTEPGLSRDGFLGGRLRILQPRRGYRAGTDPVFLAAAVPAGAGQSVLELGTGVGTAILCLATRVPGLSLAGLELQPDYAALARRNADAAGVALEVIEGDLRAMPPTLKARRFDHVMMNPPYFPAKGRTRATDPGREAARGEDAGLAAWVDAGLRRLAPKGQLTLIQDAARLPDTLAALGQRAGRVRVVPLASRAGRDASRVIVQAARDGAEFRLCPPEIIHDGTDHGRDGDDYAARASAVLRDGAAWPWVGN